MRWLTILLLAVLGGDARAAGVNVVLPPCPRNVPSTACPNGMACARVASGQQRSYLCCSAAEARDCGFAVEREAVQGVIDSGGHVETPKEGFDRLLEANRRDKYRSTDQ